MTVVVRLRTTVSALPRRHTLAVSLVRRWSKLAPLMLQMSRAGPRWQCLMVIVTLVIHSPLVCLVLTTYNVPTIN